MDGKKQIGIWFLPRLGDGVEFSFVATAVVGLGLTGNGTDEVGVNAHGKAEHIYSFGDVGLPVAAFLGVIDFVDDDIVLLLAVGSYIEGGKEDFSCVFGSSKEVNDVLLLLDDSFLLLLAVGYSLGTEYRIPKLRLPRPATKELRRSSTQCLQSTNSTTHDSNKRGNEQSPI